MMPPGEQNTARLMEEEKEQIHNQEVHLHHPLGLQRGICIYVYPTISV